jgi:hypothetical protein
MENMARGLAMRKSFQQSTIAFAAGVLLTAAAGYLFLTPVQHAQAQVANGNDKFSMVTVPISAGNENYAVFVLNHLTGVLRGAALNNSTGTFTHHYIHNAAADFQAATATPDPKYAIVSSFATFQSSGGPGQPANGVLYIGELSSGAVIAYGFQLPRGRVGGAPMPLTKLDFFRFSEAVGR